MINHQSCTRIRINRETRQIYLPDVKIFFDIQIHSNHHNHAFPGDLDLLRRPLDGNISKTTPKSKIAYEMKLGKESRFSFGS